MVAEKRVVMVTGAARGLGLAMVRGLLEAGHGVAMVDIDADGLAEAATTLSGTFVTFTGNVAHPEDARQIRDQTMTTMGGVHVLINNAGLGPQRFRTTDRANVVDVWDIALEDWHLYLDANVTGHFVMTRTIMPALLKQGWGRIINVTTSLETMINHENGAYGPSKAAAEALAAMIAGGLADSPVTCNVLIPGGPADTRMITTDGIYADRTKLIRPEVMVPPLRFLISEEASSVNNQRIRAALWHDAEPWQDNLQRAAAPIAWPQLGGQAIRPTWDSRGSLETGKGRA